MTGVVDREARSTAEQPDPCDLIRSVLARVGDKWTVVVMDELRDGPRRFNELRRLVSPITQRMLTSTLRGLESDGLATRTVHPTVPPQVEYALTDSGRALLTIVKSVATWADTHLDTVYAARATLKGPKS